MRQVDIALDLRELKIQLDSRNDFFRAWDEFLANRLVGTSIVSGQTLEFNEPRGSWRLLVLDTGDNSVIGKDTLLNVIDLARPPEVRRACKEHVKSGQNVFAAFHCRACRDENKSDFLCEEHANFLENRYLTFCAEHIPRCQCRRDCPDAAAFACDRCAKTFSVNYRQPHPNDPLTLFCNMCFAAKFESCSECKAKGQTRLGKSVCAFPTGFNGERCGKRLCTLRHARQWLIWGRHWRGAALCQTHYTSLPTASAVDLLWIIVSAKAPARFLQDRARKAHRLRNIISYHRKQDLSWNEMAQALRALEQRAKAAENRIAMDNIIQLQRETEESIKKIGEMQQDLPRLEAQYLMQVRQFYTAHLRSDPATIILRIKAQPVLGRRGEPPKYRLTISVARDSYGRSFKGLLIGKGGMLINQLKSQLNLQGVDFEE